MVKKVANKAEFDEAINSGKLCIVDFFATWCGKYVCLAYYTFYS